MFREIDYEVTGPVAEIRFRRGAADTNRMLAELSYVLELSEDDDSVVGVVIASEGSGFCEGRNLEKSCRPNFGEASFDPDSNPVDADVGSPMNCLWRMPKPVLAVIDGSCSGLGLALALMCDLRFIGEDAYFDLSDGDGDKASQSTICRYLPPIVGLGRSLDLLFNAERVCAGPALALGIVNRICAKDDLLDAAIAHMRGLAAKASPRSLGRIKSNVYRGFAPGAGGDPGGGSVGRRAGPTQRNARTDIRRWRAAIGGLIPATSGVAAQNPGLAI